MEKFIRGNLYFGVLFVGFVLAGALSMLYYERGTEIIYFNNLHTPALDAFFVMVTKLAEWPAFVLIALYLLFSSLGNGLVLLLNFLLTSAVVQFFKKALFSNIPRPAAEMGHHITLNFAHGSEVYYTNSFPSGHTAAAFALFFTLSILTKHKPLGILFFMLALVVAVSRVYLLQHYFRDVYAGAIIGVLVTSAVSLWLVNSRWYAAQPWKDKSLLKW